MTTPSRPMGKDAELVTGVKRMSMPARVLSGEANVPALSRWGVSAHADLVYRMLTAFGAQPEAAVARSLDLPLKTVRDGLDELHSLGAVAPQPDPRRPSDRTWLASPTETVVHVLRDRQARLAKARYQLRRQLSILDIVDPPAAALQTARPIYGVPAVRARLAVLVSAERREHLAMNPEPAFTAVSAKAGLPASRSALQRGVATWTLGVPATVEDQSEVHTRELYRYGLQYRELPRQPIKMMIMDRTTAFLPLDPAVHFSSGVWEIVSPAVVDNLVSFFLQHWDRAIEPSPKGWVPPTALSDRERAIIALLAAGATDAAVATKLNLSVRTIAYTLRDLMERYRVQTRFQLGLVLGAESIHSRPEQPTNGEDSR
jgi:DNA-binding CsgD family transcriptional regulator